jgi:hypothetical protein
MMRAVIACLLVACACVPVDGEELATEGRAAVARDGLYLVVSAASDPPGAVDTATGEFHVLPVASPGELMRGDLVQVAGSALEVLVNPAEQWVQGFVESVSAKEIVLDGQRIALRDRDSLAPLAEADRYVDDSLFGLFAGLDARWDGAGYAAADARLAVEQRGWSEFDQWIVNTAAGVEAGSPVPSAALQDHVQELCDRLLPFSSLHGLDRAGGLPRVRCEVIDADVVNAVSYPDGRIFVYSGMLQRVIESESQLAIVLGHEIAHVSQRHAARRFAVGAAVLAAAIAIDAYFRSGLLGELAQWALLSMARRLVMSAHSRPQEEQADRVGLAYAVAAGFSAVEAPRLWHRMHALHGAADSQLLRKLVGTHPTSVQRIENLYRELSRNHRGVPPCADAGCAHLGDRERYRQLVLEQL